MQTLNLVGSQWVKSDSGKTIEVTNPATDEVIASVPRCGRAETAKAISAAAKALPDWKARPAIERGRLLTDLASAMNNQVDRLARLMTTEQGKPLSEARGEIKYAASFLEWAGGEAPRVMGEIVPASQKDKRILVLRQPVGVSASITPWNFPSAMIARKLGPALAAGCTMVVKPAELTPLSAIAIGELALEVGIPPGVVNIITGDASEIGDELLSNPTVRKLSFTGSTKVGKILLEKSAQNVTRLSLELGGHAPLIVFDDADIPAAVEGAMATKFRNAGQTCICANRLYVQEGVYDEFLAGLRKAIADLRVGNGLEEDTDIGPLINDDAVEKVEQHVEDARSKGAKIVVGGERQSIDGLADRFYKPTLIDGFDSDMILNSEETFGPVAPVRKFKHEEQAIEYANDSIYGLAAYFFTRDAARLMRVAEGLEYGVVGANDGGPSTAQAPFGGMKQSGIGREGGHYVMDEYLETKYVSWKL